MLAWFHIQIYNTVLIEYPAALRQMIPVENSRIAAPLWIESEKMYFWAMCASIFALTVKNRKDIMSFLGIILSIFSLVIYFFSNPFKDPLPIMNGEITQWYALLPSSDMRIFEMAGTLYGRIAYYYNSTYMWTHPPMLFVAYASLIITFAACVYMLFRKDKL
jgi:cytochrome c biogenesis factor